MASPKPLDADAAADAALGAQVPDTIKAAGIQASRYELGMSSFTGTKEREQAVDFVTYFEAATSTMVRKCNPKNIKRQQGVCSRRSVRTPTSRRTASRSRRTRAPSRTL